MSIYSDARPLSRCPKLKGPQIDKIHLRQGSSNEEAAHTQTEELIDSLRVLKSKRYLHSRESEIAALIVDFSNNSNKLSELFYRSNRLRGLIKNEVFNNFVENELFGLKSGVLGHYNFYAYRLIRATITLYEITIQKNVRCDANQMIDYLFDYDQFREVDVFV